jgi:hypothetical protein
MITTIGDQPRHYERLGLRPDVVEPWEDGLRTDPGARSFEWWYLDCHLEDGSVLTAEFHTKPPFVSPSSPLTPFVLLTLERPDGTRIERSATEAPTAFSAATDRCAVTIGANTFAGGPDGYRVHVAVEGVTVDVELHAELPPFRTATGHIFFGGDEERYIAWLPVMGRAAATVDLRIDGRTERLTGVGYHDHNWGNVAPRRIVDHWYWGRARLGDHTVVTLHFVSHETYGASEITIMMVGRAGEIVALGGPETVRCTTGGRFVHDLSGVPVDNRIEYRLDDGDARYTVTFERDADPYLLDFGTAGAYHRFAGAVTLRHDVAGRSRTWHDRTNWELLWFGARTDAPGAVPLAADPA